MAYQITLNHLHLPSRCFVYEVDCCIFCSCIFTVSFLGIGPDKRASSDQPIAGGKPTFRELR